MASPYKRVGRSVSNRPGKGATFTPSVKLDPSQVQDRRTRPATRATGLGKSVAPPMARYEDRSFGPPARPGGPRAAGSMTRGKVMVRENREARTNAQLEAQMRRDRARPGQERARRPR